VVAGDAAYNDVHLYLAESDAQKRQEWIPALDKIESLKPRAVVARSRHSSVRFPITPNTVKVMRQNASPEALRTAWDSTVGVTDENDGAILRRTARR